MTVVKLVLLVSVLLCGALPPSFAQFSGPAFDEDVFIPEKGPDIDVLYSPYFDDFPWYLWNLGPAPGSAEDRISFMGYPENPYYQTIFDASPPFRLNNLTVVQKTNVKFPDGTIFGHFQSTKAKDALVTYGVKWPTIYWADENGLYDTLRRTYLISSIRGDLGKGFIDYNTNNVYATYLTSDSLEDIVIGGTAAWEDVIDSNFILLYRGGARLASQDSLYQDTSVYFGLLLNPDDYDNRRYGTTADFRGTGRKDFLASDFYGNWFFYKNDPPFTLEKFVSSMLNDTLLAAWENPSLDEFNYPYTANRFTMQALPRPWWDKSVDFMPVLNTTDWKRKTISIFRGGPHFGQNRLTLDSAEFYLRSPGLIDASWSGLTGVGPLLDAGDMTGTGNPVLMAAGSYGHIGNYLFFYTLGSAIDEKVDAIVAFPYASLTGEQITLNADKDKYRDVLFGAFNRTSDSEPLPGKAELWLFHGTNQIPAKLNPKYVVPAFYSPEQGLSVYPNPAREKITFTYNIKTTGDAVLTFQDVLGRVVWTTDFHSESGVQSVDLKLPELVAGTYVLMLRCGSEMLSAKLVTY